MNTDLRVHRLPRSNSTSSLRSWYKLSASELIDIILWVVVRLDLSSLQHDLELIGARDGRGP